MTLSTVGQIIRYRFRRRLSAPTPAPKKTVVARLVVWVFVSEFLAIPAWPQKESLALVTPLASSISKSGKHKIVVMPLAGPDGIIDALGVYLSQVLSKDLTAAVPGLELLDSKTLHLPDDLEVKPETEGDSTKFLRNLAKSGGAEICIIGDFAPFRNQLGISLHAYSSDDSLLSESYGEIPIGAEITAVEAKPLKYAPPPDGVFSAGLGGTSKPACLNCSSASSSRGSNVHGGGLASMDVVVGPDGHTRDVKVLESSSPTFASRAKEEVQSLRYTVATAPDGTPVAVHFRMEFAVVELEITVTADGSVAQARVIQSPKKAISDRALDAVRKWKLKPATDKEGHPVAVTVPTEIAFKLY